MDYSTQIFSLGVLLSSLLVFNQVRGTGCMFVCVLILLIQFHSFHTYGTGSFQSKFSDDYASLQFPSQILACCTPP